MAITDLQLWIDPTAQPQVERICICVTVTPEELKDRYLRYSDIGGTQKEYEGIVAERDRPILNCLHAAMVISAGQDQHICEVHTNGSCVGVAELGAKGGKYLEEICAVATRGSIDVRSYMV